MTKRRDEPKTPEGKTGKITTGGKAGRTPGLGTRNNSGTKPGQGVDRPTQGYGLAGSRRHPPEDLRPKPKLNPPKDET